MDFDNRSPMEHHVLMIQLADSAMKCKESIHTGYEGLMSSSRSV
jgi:hypothetical protein